MTKCQRCQKNEATITYTDSVLSYTHGFTEQICVDCYRKQLKSSIKNMQDTLDELDKKEESNKKNGKKGI
jgi:protein-arginine kinase activator protein McsA